MRALLDTHVFLWWINEDPRLSRTAREFLSDEENDLIFSVASVWEMAIKIGSGKLDITGDLGAYVSAYLRENNMEVLQVNLRHAAGIVELPDHHRDPFDRLLVAQALAEDVAIVTIDPQVTRYPVETIW
ncbi:type II toxin-antitoxin system VapC family toxin [soil metagenome]